ncbi:hypothetical protein FW759_04210 [Psychrobacter sp. 1176_08]
MKKLYQLEIQLRRTSIILKTVMKVENISQILTDLSKTHKRQMRYM